MDYKIIKIHNGKIFATTIIIVTVAFTYIHTKQQTVVAPESTYYRVSVFYETPVCKIKMLFYVVNNQDFWCIQFDRGHGGWILWCRSWVSICYITLALARSGKEVANIYHVMQTPMNPYHAKLKVSYWLCQVHTLMCPSYAKSTLNLQLGVTSNCLTDKESSSELTAKKGSDLNKEVASLRAQLRALKGEMEVQVRRLKSQVSGEAGTANELLFPIGPWIVWNF